jgi:hypothetical protein
MKFPKDKAVVIDGLNHMLFRYTGWLLVVNKYNPGIGFFVVDGHVDGIYCSNEGIWRDSVHGGWGAGDYSPLEHYWKKYKDHPVASKIIAAEMLGAKLNEP